MNVLAKILRYVADGLGFFLAHIPHRLFVWHIKSLAFMMRIFDRRRFKDAKANLDFVYGEEMSEEQKRALIKKCYENFAFVLLETIRVPFISTEAYARYFTFIDEHYILESLQKDKGAVLVSAHYGYWEAMASVLDGTFTEEKKDEWDKRLATVFNRGFWDGYYQGQRLGEWNSHYGSCATEKKVYVGRGVKYFSKLGVAEFTCEACEFEPGDRLLVTGPTTGVMYVTPDEIHGDNGAVAKAEKGTRVSIAVPEKVRPSDKLFKLVSTGNGLDNKTKQ